MVVRSDVLHPGHPVQHVIYRAANIAVHRSRCCPKHTGRGLLRHLRALRGPLPVQFPYKKQCLYADEMC